MSGRQEQGPDSGPAEAKRPSSQSADGPPGDDAVHRRGDSPDPDNRPAAGRARRLRRPEPSAATDNRRDDEQCGCHRARRRASALAHRPHPEIRGARRFRRSRDRLRLARTQEKEGRQTQARRLADRRADESRQPARPCRSCRRSYRSRHRHRRLPSAATANRPRLAPSMAGTVAGQPQRRAAQGRRRSVRRGRLLSRQHAGEARDRILDRLRHQPRPHPRTARDRGSTWSRRNCWSPPTGSSIR